MKSTNSIKENMIIVTTALIEESNGDIRQITTRAIAEKANVGIGLINYHFKNKDNLIMICVQRIIGNVVLGFKPKGKHYTNDRERLTDWAIYVFEFLFKNPAIARISILGDLEHYTACSNSAYTQKGFIEALDKEVLLEDRAFLAFVLTSAMQIAFLGSDAYEKITGISLTTPSDRAKFITRLVSGLIYGFGNDRGEQR